MFGIILKDYYESFCLKKNALEILFSLFCLSMMVIFSSSVYTYALMVLLIFSLVGISPLQYSMEQDEISKFDQILLTYPLSKKDIVLSKFMVTFSFNICLNGIISSLVMLIYVFIYKSVDLNLAFFIWGLGIVLSFIMIAFYNVGFFWLGNKKGLILYLVITILAISVYTITNFSIGIESILTLEKVPLFIIFALMAIGANILSYFTCIKIYTKKHS